ncbi:MucBP domain-containing protein, partial [Leuconostoc suionicum]|uniref:MucBP domain-containing protein n=1 Tax=Leuconostoc suionicum TaxID=1511761 RepID=UPI004036107C
MEKKYKLFKSGKLLVIGATGLLIFSSPLIINNTFFIPNKILADSLTTVYVRYFDEEGNNISPTRSVLGENGTEYTTQPKQINNYSLVHVPENKNGIFSSQSDYVDYIYHNNRIDEKKGTVIIHNIDESGQRTFSDQYMTGYIGDDYSTRPSVYIPYTLVKTEGNISGQYTEESQEITYVYTRSDYYGNSNTNFIVSDTDDNPIENAKFSLYKQNSDGFYELIGEDTSNSLGYLYNPNFLAAHQKYGKYYYKQISTIKNYNIDMNEHYFEVQKHGKYDESESGTERIINTLSSSETPNSEVPSSETPSSEVPSSEVPSSETPSSEVPSSETPSSEVPSSETP